MFQQNNQSILLNLSRRNIKNCKTAMKSCSYVYTTLIFSITKTLKQHINRVKAQCVQQLTTKSVSDQEGRTASLYSVASYAQCTYTVYTLKHGWASLCAESRLSE